MIISRRLRKCPYHPRVRARSLSSRTEGVPGVEGDFEPRGRAV